MLVIGELSGIQEYLLDVAHEGGGQARRLRARSFYLQLVTECFALAVRRALKWPVQSLIFCSAGRFVLREGTLDAGSRDSALQCFRQLESWLLAEAGGRLRVAFAMSGEERTPEDQYRAVRERLDREKASPWKRLLATDDGWHSELMTLAPLDTPCTVCRRQRGEIVEQVDDDMRLVCHRCHEDLEIGRRLPGMSWLAVKEASSFGDVEIAGMHVALSAAAPSGPSAGHLALASLRSSAPWPESWPSEKRLERPLARHIPVDDHGPIEFSALAARSTGDVLLGVLKMDADHLGLALDRLLEADGLTSLAALSRELDDFFSRTLDQELHRRDWVDIYTIFAGGDDLLVAGPWNRVLDYAGEVEQRFRTRFSKQGLTLSAGLAFNAPRRPIKAAVEAAIEALHRAKNEPGLGATSSRDQICAFGQVWKWKDHSEIVRQGRALAGWVGDGSAERGWLRTLLELSDAGHSRLARAGREDLATAHLAYHVARNYPKSGPLRSWAERLIEDFDTKSQLGTRYLPAIVRHAVAATRRRES